MSFDYYRHSADKTSKNSCRRHQRAATVADRNKDISGSDDIPPTKHQRTVAANIKEPPLLPTGTRTFPVQMTFRHVRRVYKRTRVHTALLSRRHHITHHIDSKLTPRPYGPEAEHITTVTSLQSHLYLHLSTPLYRIA